jgi:hypothetical protein
MPKSTKTTQSTTTTTKTRTRKPQTAPPTLIISTPNHADIANRAYELFLSSGARHGRDVDHWLQAETELRERSFGAGR